MADLEVSPLADSFNKNVTTEEIKEDIEENNSVSTEPMNVDLTESVIQSNQIFESNVENNSNDIDSTKKVDEAEVVQYLDYKFQNNNVIANFDGPHTKHFAGCKWLSLIVTFYYKFTFIIF